MDRIYIGSDHGGFELKNRLREALKSLGIDVVDVGPSGYDKDDDYPDYAEKVCGEIEATGGRGILICKSGHGMVITANKFRGIRASLCWSKESAVCGKRDDDINVLCLPGDFVTAEQAIEVAKAWIDTPYGTAGRYARRLSKVQDIEDRNFRKQ